MADEAKIEQLVKTWLSYDKFPNTRKEIETLWEQKNLKELKARLETRIDFGTAGLRAKMAAGFACMNELIIVQTTQGLAAYMEEIDADASLKNKGVVIGYDGRYNSKTYAELTAAVFLAKGFKVLLYPTMCPTPLVPFAVRHLGLAAGIMVTASHNPKQDNGYKLYWSNGCQIISPIDAEVSQRIMKNLQIWDSVDISCKTIYENPMLDQHLEETIDAYFAKIAKLYCYEKAANPKSALRVTYTAMHGVGAPWVSRALREFGLPAYIPTVEQVKADPEFPTVAYPNPEEGKGALKLAMETADKANSRLILANDPDADRLAVAEKQPDGTWRIFNGNEIALLFAHWAWVNYKAQNPSVDPKKCCMLSSTVSSKILRAMAEVEGFHFEDTLTGFKWIGNRADALIKQGYTFIFGFEVEIGFLVGDLSLDKDGVRTAAIFNEMAKSVYQHSFSLAHHLDNLYKKYGFYVMKTRYFFTPTVETVATVMNAIRVINNGTYPTQVAGFKIKSVRDLTVGFDSAQPDNKPVLPVSAANQMITFSFEDGSTCTLRNSGTEPKLKYYMECSDKESKEKALERVEALKQAIIQELMQPQKYGLVPPKDE